MKRELKVLGIVMKIENYYHNNKLLKEKKNIYGFVFLLLLFLSGIFYIFLLNNPKNALLVERNEAKWIYYKTPFQLNIQNTKHLTTFFRKSFQLPYKYENLFFSFKAMKSAIIKIDDRKIFSSDEIPDHNWKQEISIEIPNDLNPGSHVMTIEVSNNFGPPVFMGFCEDISLKTDEQWDASIDCTNWIPSITVNTYLPPYDCACKSLNELPLNKKFIRADRIFLQHSAFIILFLIIMSIFFYLYDRCIKKKIIDLQFLTVNKIAILLFIMWGILSINNLFKVPFLQGMDAKRHYEYIFYIAQNWKVPFAYEGWQMFQPPLYYFISAILYKFLIIFINPLNSLYLLKIISILCGAMQIEICRRMVRYAFNDRNDLQSIALVIGSLLPMNIYMSQYIGNEPLSAFFTSIAVFQSVKYIASYPESSKKICFNIGLFIGLAILTKVTAILFIPVIIMMFLWKAYTNEKNKTETIKKFAVNSMIFLGSVFVISAWYYIRNFLEMGYFFIGGWDNDRGIQWWQHPGFRTPSQFITFGYSLFYPVYAAVRGFWDSIYSTLWMDGFLSGTCSFSGIPKWNYNYLFITVWLSLPLTIAGITSFFIKIFSKRNEIMFFCTICISTYIIVIAYLYLNVPIYSTAKASYMLGLSTCIAILCTDGLHYLMINKKFRVIVYSFVVCWSFYSYLGYFVI